MQTINFVEEYEDKDGILVCKNEHKVGLFEIMDVMITNMAADVGLSKKEHKANKKLRAKMKLVGVFKDKEQNALVCNGQCTLELEDAEHDVLMKQLNCATPKVNPKYSGLLIDLLDLVGEKT